jgi:CHAD domain-containing protein
MDFPDESRTAISVNLAILSKGFRSALFKSEQMSTAPQTVYFKVNQQALSGPLAENMLPSGYRIEALGSKRETRVIYETFEWNAFEKGIVVEKRKRVLYLLDLKTGNKISSVPFSGKPSFFFADSLPPGETAELLRSCSLIRSFIKQCSVEIFSHPYRILDDNDKTIGILKSESWHSLDRSEDEPFAHIVSLRPNKGYQKDIELIEKSLTRDDAVGEALGFRKFFLFIMSAAGSTVQGYSSKIQLSLDADAPVHENTRRLLLFCLSIMRQNEEGIRKNMDTEFLHDYRVAIRRTRSLLKQLKGVFDPLVTRNYLNAFKDLGKRTNKLRDSDVCLLRQAAYFSYLPPTLQPSLKLFFCEIEKSRSSLHKLFCRYLESPDYRSFMDEWERFLSNPKIPDSALAPKAHIPTSRAACSSIKKAWKKVLRHGRQIKRQATDKELHTLRINCKKLRYLLEFFSSVFPRDTIAPAIKQLKELQDNLGSFVDYTVQIQFLHERLIPVADKPGDRLCDASIGGLMAILYQKQEFSRQNFHASFCMFDNEDTTRLFHELLSRLHRDKNH